ncbi:MAG: type I-U CRISPR-associated RAMP protein Csb1/Cas7u [Microthrixaceae bacterium]
MRTQTELSPLGGPDDKVFPPTYSGQGGRATYATEDRRVGRETQTSVVLDSVASQANRQELALLVAKENGAQVPTVNVDFSDTDVPDLDTISALEASHRVFDAIFRDSLNGELLFRMSPEGRAITEATPKNAAALLALSPTTLLFGGWDSTGPKGGLGAKYERAITSEIVAVGIEPGKKTASRIDALGVEKAAGPIYQARDADEAWTIDPDEAETDKKGPVKFGSAKSADAGRPSMINHGNVVPSIEDSTGGVTADRIVATSVLSFAQLRRLRFPVAVDGSPIGDDERAAAMAAARAALAALGLLAITAATEQGYDLRSRCVLVAHTGLTFELVGRTLDDVTEFTLTTEEAQQLLDEAVADVRARGLHWNEADLVLKPTPKLVELVLRSRDHAVQAEPGEDE